MDRNFVVLFVVVDVFILALGGFLAYSDLYIRKDASRWHENTTLVGVEHSLFGYRPTYDYWDVSSEPASLVVTEGSWTLDFFQITIIAVIISLLWFLSKKQKNDQKTYSFSY